jgi:hypothetical protein
MSFPKPEHAIIASLFAGKWGFCASTTCTEPAQRERVAHLNMSYLLFQTWFALIGSKAPVLMEMRAGMITSILIMHLE